MPVRRVSEEELRRLLNVGRYYERMLAKEFRTVIVRDTPRHRGDRRIRKTRSQIVEYWDDSGVRVAVVHQYRKTDGSLGASGRPDPKLLRHEGVLYVLKEEEQWDVPDW